MRRRSLCALAVLAAACADHESVLGPPDTAFAISDGHTEGGNAHFFWLPPIGKAPSDAGPLDATLQPEVHICVLSGDACGETVAVFDMFNGRGSERLRVDEAGHYIVNWNTGRTVIDLAATYRIHVLLEGSEIGFADVVGAVGDANTTIDATQFVAIQPGQTLPIRFHLGPGAGTPDPEPEPGIARRGIATGPFHACGLTTEGAAWCWGSGWSGQLGHGAYGAVIAPAAVAGDLRFTALAAGTSHTCGIAEDRSTWCWGSNGSGSLGTGTTGGSSNVPVAVVAAPPFTRIEAGNGFTCGLTEIGELHCWGFGFGGQLGNGVTGNSPSPMPVSGGHIFAAFDVGADHTCGVTTAGQALCWGANGWGQMGDGNRSTTYPYTGSNTPTPVLGDLVLSAISAGTNHTCALDAAGAAWCWGAGYDGQLGDGTTEPFRTIPTAVLGGLALLRIDAGSNHTCGVTGDGAGWCWGANWFGQTGTGPAGSPGRIPQPSPVQGGLAWNDIRSGETHSCGVTTDGSGWCWGLGTLGGTASSSDAPITITGDLTFAMH